MELTWSLDEIARISEDEAVRRRFAQRNRVWLIVLLLVFTFVSVLEMGANSRTNTPFDVLIAAANFVFVTFGLFFMRYTRWRAGAWLRAHANAAALSFVAIQYALVLTFTRNTGAWYGWVACFPLLMLGFRMAAAELVLLHVYLLAGTAVMWFVGSAPNQEGLPFYVTVAVLSGLALGMELWMSHRMRKKVTSDWSLRRADARERIRMRDELRYARELQLSMLPECAPALAWADICSISVPATEVGGDYYDYFVHDERVALVCGDVAGHGMAAGLVLAGLRSGFTLLRDSLGDPSAVLQRLHSLVAETSRRRMLVTVSVVLIDRAAQRVTIASAGHPPVILRRANGDIETIDLFAPPLGVRLPVAIPQRVLPLTPGDTFVLHSDGVYESRNVDEESYGFERLERVVRDHGGGAAEELRNAILRDVAEFRGEMEQDDDVTVVVCRIGNAAVLGA
ncbi:MAG TPA: PP2C family protein-serine/threonine phosphatase [Thermoanaerobaculia bacterium]|nr:PP2C family protein-serine/threonine phosphatase [Thermoanaerobaculia bacterium]